MMATVFKTAEPDVNRPVGGFDSHTLPLFKFASGRQPPVPKVQIVKQKRKKLTESVWFWIYLFSTAGLISLVILQNKFDTRQNLEEINFQARMQTYEGSTANSALTENQLTKTQIVTLTPLYILFGSIFAISWILLWKQQILRKPSKTQPESLPSTNSEPPLSTEHS